MSRPVIALAAFSLAAVFRSKCEDSQSRVQPDPNASPSKFIFVLEPPSHGSRLKTLSAVVNRT
jgi:hypothetical protein